MLSSCSKLPIQVKKTPFPSTNTELTVSEAARVKTIGKLAVSDSNGSVLKVKVLSALGSKLASSMESFPRCNKTQ